MIEKIILSLVCFLLFTYVFIFKLIKKNDTIYLTVLIMQAIGILLNFIQIFFNILTGIFFKVIIYLFCIVIPILIFVLENKGIDYSELMCIWTSKVLLFLGANKKAKNILMNFVAKYDKNYAAHKLLAEIYEKEGGMRKAIDEYIKVLDIKTDDYESYFKISKLLNDLARKDEAIQMLGTLVKKKPEFFEANRMLRRFANGKRKI